MAAASGSGIARSMATSWPAAPRAAWAARVRSTAGTAGRSPTAGLCVLFIGTAPSSALLRNRSISWQYALLRCRSKVLYVSNRLSTTSYAVLSLLALRSWTGYELTQQARRSLAHCWPKEDSVLYEEPRRLAAMGLAEAQKERGRGRGRNRYSITGAGREALRAWLATPSAPPRLELEPMLRLTFADQGELADAQAAVATLRDWAVSLRTEGMAVLRGYQAG